MMHGWVDKRKTGKMDGNWKDEWMESRKEGGKRAKEKEETEGRKRKREGRIRGEGRRVIKPRLHMAPVLVLFPLSILCRVKGP